MHDHSRVVSLALRAIVTALAAGTVAGCRDEAVSAPAATATISADRASLGEGGQSLDQIRHVIVIYNENHSFDNFYGEFPGADGLSSPAAHRYAQVDSSENPYATLPMVAGSPFPTTLPNAPFAVENYVQATVAPPDLVHRFYQEQEQIDGGRMDHFALVSDVQGQSMGYYHTADLPLAAEALQYTLCDHFFHAAFGGSFLNHQWLIAARTPVFPNAPASVVAVLGNTGSLVKDGFVTPDGYDVNTSYSVNTPHPASVPAVQLVPDQTYDNIGDRLSGRGVSWAWYSGGWNDAVAGHPGALFQFHHQPFIYFKNYADGTTGRAKHLKDETDFLAALSGDSLPAVAFVKPYGANNEHPGYTDVITGENHTIELINAVRQSKAWAHSIIIITYDEHGGWWDHVAPPVVDRWGPGSRVPALVISPFVRRRFVDHRHYDTTSILALIEARWHVEPLTSRDASADPLSGVFDFDQRGNDDRGGDRN